MRIGSLFAGIGGFDLAARWMGWETAWFSEIDRYASNVLAKHWPDVPNHGDITKIDFTKVEPVDLLCGGFPCQDISLAGKRAGIGGARSGLWSEYARAVRAVRPRWVVIENVPPLLTSGFALVRSDLRDAGYIVARPVVMSASAVGAEHLRERLWIVGHAAGQGRRRWGQREAGRIGFPRRASQDVPLWSSGVAIVGADGKTRCLEPGTLPVAYGVPARVVQLRGYGNAIVPQCAYQIFSAIEAREAHMRAA